jgi:hypothetical protein
LKDKIEVRWTSERTKQLLLKTDPETGAPKSTPACYPAREVSRRLLYRNLLFSVLNWDFTILMGVIYWALAIPVGSRPQIDIYIITFIVFSTALIAYTRYQEKSDSVVIWGASLVHAIAQTVALIALTSLFTAYNTKHFVFTGEWFDVWKWLALFLIEMGAIGGIVGSFLFGLNLLITCYWFDMNHNDAFSAMRLNTYRHFLRIRITEDEVKLYVIGLDNVPSRDGWAPNPQAGKIDQPVFVPRTPLQPCLIEGAPIVVRSGWSQ